MEKENRSNEGRKPSEDTERQRKRRGSERSRGREVPSSSRSIRKSEVEAIQSSKGASDHRRAVDGEAARETRLEKVAITSVKALQENWCRGRRVKGQPLRQGAKRRWKMTEPVREPLCPLCTWSSPPLSLAILSSAPLAQAGQRSNGRPHGC